MRRLRRLRLSRFLWIPIILVLVGAASGLALWLASGPGDWKGLGLNLATELVGAAVTYILLVLILERTETTASEKARLIAEMSSRANDVAIAAVEKLRRHGWLEDGSLHGKSLWGANLKGADLMGANLREAVLVNANLIEADLRWANLEGTHLNWTLLVGAILEGAMFDEKTTLPDLTKWTQETDLKRFTDPKHPAFWLPPTRDG